MARKQTPRIEKKPDSLRNETPFENFDDLNAYNESLERAMKRADDILGRMPETYSAEEKGKLKSEIPVLVRTLRHLLEVQMDRNSTIAKMDMADWSYDNAGTDERLRLQLSALRNLNADLNSSWWLPVGWVRKLTGTIREDLPNWYGVRSRQILDYLKQGAMGTAVVGGLTAAGLLTGYSLYAGSLTGGLEILGGHLGTVGTFIGSNLRTIGEYLSGPINTIGGAISSGATATMNGLSGLKDRIFKGIQDGMAPTEAVK